MKQRCPQLKGKRVVFQHDGAKAHNGKGNLAALNIAGKEDGWDIEVVTQPAQSPDLNKLDLCLFHGLQRSTNKIKANNPGKENMINAVLQAYEEYDVATIERVEGLQHEVYRCILRDGGGNQFDMPHSGVRERQKMGKKCVTVKYLLN